MPFRILILAASLLLPLATNCVAEEAAGETVTAAAPTAPADPQIAQVLPPPAISSNLQIRVQLIDLSATAGQPSREGFRAGLEGIRVRAIASDGSFTEAFSGPDGRATLGVQSEPTVLTATGNDRHATLMVYPQRVDTGEAPRPVTIPLLRASREVLMRNIEGLAAARSTLPAPDTRQPANVDALPPLEYRVPLSPDGNLDGRLVTLDRGALPRSEGLGGMNVSILRGGSVIRTTISEANGRFTITDLAPGVYGVIASGSAGFGAFGFEAVSADEPTTVSHARASVTPVSLRQPASTPSLAVVLVPPSMVPAVTDSIVAAYPPGAGPGPIDGLAGLGAAAMPMAPFGGGPGAGFSGGGGGAAGGAFGGGLGGLLIPAAIGAGIFAAVDDDDDEDFVPPPASPLLP